MEKQTEEKTDNKSAFGERISRLHEEGFAKKLLIILLSVLAALLIGIIGLKFCEGEGEKAGDGK